jgi:hypothetical protein
MRLGGFPRLWRHNGGAKGQCPFALHERKEESETAQVEGRCAEKVQCNRAIRADVEHAG